MKPNRLLAIVLMFTACIVVESRGYHDVMWSSKFFDKAYRHSAMQVRLGDQLSIICPQKYYEGHVYEYAKLYWVSKTEWSECFLKKPKWVGICANETESVVIKMIFRRTNPIPNGMEFEIGKTYYIISTSSGDREDLDQSYGGLCESKQMKLAITVHGDKIEDSNSWAPMRKMAYEVHDYQPLMSAGIIFQIHSAVLASVLWLLFHRHI